ncbi:hypothetical protein OfM1_19060 [Lactovum odontotermitis]
MIKILAGKTQLQIMREAENITAYDLARSIANMYGYKAGGDVNHLYQTINDIEADKGVFQSIPRKTYELKYIAKRLNCKVEDLI